MIAEIVAWLSSERLLRNCYQLLFVFQTFESAQPFIFYHNKCSGGMLSNIGWSTPSTYSWDGLYPYHEISSIIGSGVKFGTHTPTTTSNLEDNCLKITISNGAFVKNNATT